MTIDIEAKFWKYAVRYLIVASSLFGLSFSTNAAHADKRVALVIGNGAYKISPQLSSASIDAIAIATMLRSVGFDVVVGTNLTKSQIIDKYFEFRSRADCADIIVYFYAGHSLAISGRNYILPVDDNLIKTEMDVSSAFATSVLFQNTIEAKVKLIFFDVAGVNPIATRIQSTSTHNVNAGLDKIVADAGMLVARSTDLEQFKLDGQAATVSPFVQALTSQLARPGMEIQQAIREIRAQLNETTNKVQVSWETGGLNGPVVLNPISASSVRNMVGANSSTTSQRHDCIRHVADEEELLWRSVQNTEDAQDLNDYLQTYPKGQFSSLARGKLAALDQPQLIPLVRWPNSADSNVLRDNADEEKIGLNRSQRRNVQRQLTNLGFDMKMSGEFDRDTRWVIKRWQAAQGYPVSGYLNATQYEELAKKDAVRCNPPEKFFCK